MYDDATMMQTITDLREIQDREGFLTVWSAWEICTAEGMDQPIPGMDMGPNTIVFRYFDRDFKDQEVRARLPYDTETWLDMWRACDKLIRSTDDYHIFIEGFEMLDPRTILIHCGS